ncbi:hypothetical protein [Streptomyces erythrochromogenes]|uniref:hypothetical protein n=1 Tax=Streptomyces erythrochromogenes TaxID=285574 RepID=UPI00380468E8
MRLVRANAETKAEARAAPAGLEPAGAVSFGRWLRLADQLLAAHGDAVRTATLLMDLTVTAESPAELPAVLASCAGRFSCHACGIGAGWEVAPIRSVTTALSGTVDIVMDPSEPTSQLTGDLTSLIARSRAARGPPRGARALGPGAVWGSSRSSPSPYGRCQGLPKPPGNGCFIELTVPSGPDLRRTYDRRQKGPRR